ncbi:MAG TPA: hypothetical protein VJ729_05245 [Nitrososphaeraceae archaeon]|nr:hypothetical protein [Nitrososphaeraceae archaeon]
MYLDIHRLEIANGLKDALVHADFTVDSIIKSGPSRIASTMGIDLYVAKIIFNAAKKAANANDLTELENNKDIIKPINITR